MVSPKYCRECKWSKVLRDEYSLRCMHPVVNASSAWSLGSPNVSGVSCTDERALGFFSKCGKSGKLYER